MEVDMNKIRSLFLILTMLLLSLSFVSCLSNKLGGQNKPNENESLDNQGPSLYFELNEDGASYSVIAPGEQRNYKNIIIPKSYMGLPVTGIGIRAFDYCPYLESVTIPDSITAINNTAFSGCSSLKSVIIPDSVTAIGNSAFYECTSLESVTIPDSVTQIGHSAFYNCKALSEVKLSESLIKIDSSAFSGCSALTEIILPDSLLELGAGAFSGCTSLQSVVMGKNIKEMKATTSEGSREGTFSSCVSLKHVELPEGISYIPSYAFSGCSLIRDIEIPYGVVEIQKGAFSYCSSLTDITIPENVRSIDDTAFKGSASLFEICNKSEVELNSEYLTSVRSIIKDEKDTKLKNVDGFIFFDDGEELSLIKYIGKLTRVTLPEYPTGKKYSIETNIFSLTPDIIELTIPDCIDTIATDAFSNCNSLLTLHFDCRDVKLEKSWFRTGGNKSVQILFINADNNIRFSFFDNLTTVIYGEGVTYVPKYAFRDSDLKKAVISSTITEIGDCAFKGADLTQLVFNTGSQLEVIGNEAFSSCLLPSRVVLPGGVKTIGDSAFHNVGAVSISLGHNLVSIGESAFSGSPLLETVTLPNSLITIGNNAFLGCSRLHTVNIYEESQLESIGDTAFRGCRSLTEIYFPQNLSYIGINAFQGTQIKKMTLAENNPYFEMIGEDLYSENKTVFLLCPQNRVDPIVIIPYFVKEIAPYAFSCAGSITAIIFEDGSELEVIGERAFYGVFITEITIPAGVSRIEREAFSFCQSMEKITFAEGSKLTELSDDAFSGCSRVKSFTVSINILKIGETPFPSVENLYYEGSLDMWLALEKDDNWDGNLGNYADEYRVYCSDGVIIVKKRANPPTTIIRY